MGNLIRNVEVFLEGKKTLGQCAIGLGLIGAVAVGWIEIDPKLYAQLKDALIFGAIAALRASK